MALLCFRVRSLSACQKASAAAEFALVSPLLFALLLGTVEFGSVSYAFSAMQSAANRAARQIAINAVPPATAVAEARAQLPPWMQAKASIGVAQSAPSDVAANMITVRLSLPSNQMAVSAMMSNLVPWTMRAEATTKQELPYVD